MTKIKNNILSIFLVFIHKVYYINQSLYTLGVFLCPRFAKSNVCNINRTIKIFNSNIILFAVFHNLLINQFFITAKTTCASKKVAGDWKLPDTRHPAGNYLPRMLEKRSVSWSPNSAPNPMVWGSNLHQQQL